MFDLQARRKWNPAVVASLLLHGALLLGILWHRPHAIFVRPSSVAHGDGPKAYYVVYLPPGSRAGDEEAHANAMLPSSPPARKKHQQRGAEAAKVQRKTPQEGEASDHYARAGTPYGSLFSGPSEGHDVRPGYPVVFPDPPVDRSEVPNNLTGDVIVEVTIDERGNVIETRLLQGVGHGIDEKVLATVQNWRYHPAMMDGRPIASKHDVHFHFPA